jgi:hypothetical protein
VVQADTESEQSAVTSSPFFQVVRRSYDCTQVDAYIPELVARMAAAEQARAEPEREVASISTLLERTLKHRAQEAPTAEGTAEPKAHPSPRPPASRPSG